MNVRYLYGFCGLKDAGVEMQTGEQGFYSVNILLNCSLTDLTLKSLSVCILQSSVAASLRFCNTNPRFCFGTRAGMG